MERYKHKLVFKIGWSCGVFLWFYFFIVCFVCLFLHECVDCKFCSHYNQQLYFLNIWLTLV